MIPSSLILAGFSLVSRLLGLWRNNLLAVNFGALSDAAQQLDAYYAAFRLPDLIYQLLVLGVVSAAFVPIFSGYLRRSKAKAWQFAASLLNAILLVVTVVVLFAMVFTPWLVTLLAPGFSGELREVTIQMTRVMLISPLCFAVSSVVGAILTTLQRFFYYALAPVLYNLGIIGGILYLTPKYGVMGVGYGVVLGAVLHMVVQVVDGWRAGWRPAWVLDLKDAEMVEMGRLMLPRIVGLGAVQIGLVVDTIIASMLISGSLTVFYLAENIQALPLGLVGIPLAIATFPVLADMYNQRQSAKFQQLLQSKAEQIICFILPIMVVTILMRTQIVRLLYGYGEFATGWHSTVITASVLGFFAVSFLAQALIPLLTRAYYARHNTRTPVLIAVSTVAVNVILSVGLARIMGVIGLALAFSLAAIWQMTWLLISMRGWYKMPAKQGLALVVALGKLLLAALVMAAGVQLVKYGLGTLYPLDTVLNVMIQMVGASLVGGAIYGGLLLIFQVPVAQEMLAKVWRR